jgi:hypothetical protein
MTLASRHLVTRKKKLGYFSTRKYAFLQADKPQFAKKQQY